jgi:hypothetical protein
MTLSPTTLTLRWYHDAGWDIDVTERRIKTGIGKSFLKDLFGFADLMAFGQTEEEGPQILLIQATDMSNRSKRRDKILQNSIARRWAFLTGYPIHLVAWRLDRDPPEMEVVEICREDFAVRG